MTMKPEYNYEDEKSYSVYVYDSPFKIGFAGKIFMWVLFRIWFDYINTTHTFEGLSEEQIKTIQPELDKVRSYRVCEKHHYTLFRNDILMANLRTQQIFSNLTPEKQNQRYFRSARLGNEWDSQELAKLNEYSFELWAENEQIDEAYRLTIIPSFHNTLVIRLWIKNDIAKFVYKIHGGQVNCQNQLKHHTEKRLRYEKWQEVHKFMKHNFWTAETWSPPSWIEINGRKGRLETLDGEKYLFEGWRDDKYKLLDGNNQVSARAMKLLLSLARKKTLDFSSFNRRIDFRYMP